MGIVFGIVVNKVAVGSHKSHGSGKEERRRNVEPGEGFRSLMVRLEQRRGDNAYRPEQDKCEYGAEGAAHERRGTAAAKPVGYQDKGAHQYNPPAPHSEQAESYHYGKQEHGSRAFAEQDGMLCLRLFGNTLVDIVAERVDIVVVAIEHICRKLREDYEKYAESCRKQLKIAVYGGCGASAERAADACKQGAAI